MNAHHDTRSEAERTGRRHPTPLAIKVEIFCALYDAETLRGERLPSWIYDAVSEGIIAANKHHHGEISQ